STTNSSANAGALAASAASAALDNIRRLLYPTPEGDWFSAAIPSEGNTYGISDNLMYSFPLRSKGNGEYEPVLGLELSDYAKGKLKISEDELLEEREAIKNLLK
ncbi:MAG: malate dehydrogenase, partial [Anaerolineae bacterium]|nr:malate dehydrogenase [Anaerolineae bacterium]